MITLPFVAVGIALAIYVNGIIGDHLDTSLYGPVCKTTCRELDGRTIGHRLGGRGRSGEVDCQCLDTKDSWHEADLSGGSSVDLALHHGGQEVLLVGTLSVLGLTSLVVGVATRQVRVAADLSLEVARAVHFSELTIPATGSHASSTEGVPSALLQSTSSVLEAMAQVVT